MPRGLSRAVAQLFGNPFSDITAGWYGDHGGGDDSLMVWNVTSCSTNADGPPQNGVNDSLPYRCCY